MKLPKWDELTQKISEFEKSVDDVIGKKVQRFQDRHPLGDKTVKVLISILPPPFNAIAENIYSSSEGSDEGKFEKITEFLSTIREQGEDHFNGLSTKISSEFDNVNMKLDQINDKSAMQSTVLSIRDILLSKNEHISEQLEDLRITLERAKRENEIIRNTINQARSQGLTLLAPNHFKENNNTDPNFEEWKNGFNFNLESIYYRKEYRREDVLFEIQKRLEEQHRLLLLGESGTSKSTIWMEVICYYFDKGYKILYSEGTEELRDPPATAEFIRDLIRGGNKVLVAVDNVHENRMASTFYLINLLQSFDKKDNAIFLLAARQPEYDQLLEKRRIEDKYVEAIDSLFGTKSNYIYEMKSLNVNEIISFIDKYREFLPYLRNGTSLEEIANKIFKDTQGLPIMVKFSVLGEGLVTDAKNRYNRYLIIEKEGEKSPDNKKIQTVIVVSLFHLSTIPITSYTLEKMRLLEAANDLDKAILYCNSDRTWKTIHPRWDLELISYLFSFKNKNLLNMMKNNFFNGVKSIFNECDEKSVLHIMSTINSTIGFANSNEDDTDFNEVISNIYLNLGNERQDKIFRVASKDIGLANTLGTTIGRSFTSIKDRSLQIKILDQANLYASFAEGLFNYPMNIYMIKDKNMWNSILNIVKRNDDVADSLAFSIGIGLGGITDMEILKKVLDEARKNKTFGNTLGDSIGQAFTEIERVEVQKMIFKIAKENEAFASGFYGQLGITFPDLDSHVKDKILREALDNKKIANDLAIGIGSSLSSFVPKDKDKLFNMAKEDENFAHDLGEGIGQKSNHINMNDVLEFATQYPAFADGLGKGIGSNYSTVEDKKKVIELVKKNPAFAGGFGSGLSDWINQNLEEMYDDFLENIVNLMLDSNAFAKEVASVLGENLYNIKKISTRQIIFEKARSDKMIGEELFHGIGSVFLELDHRYQDEVLDLAKLHPAFSSGLGGGLDYQFEKIRDKRMQGRILDLAENDPNFGNKFGGSLACYFTDKEQPFFMQLILEILSRNKSKMLSNNIGNGLGREFYSIRDKDVKKKILKIAEKNREFGYSFAYLIGQGYLFNPRSEYRDRIVELIQKNDAFAKGLGEGVGIDLNGGIPKKGESKKLLEECWEIANENDAFATGLGISVAIGIRGRYVDDDTKVNLEIRELASKRLGQSSKFFFGLGIGRGRAILPMKLNHSEAWQEAKNNKEFALGLGTAMGEQFEDYDKPSQESIMALASENSAFAEGLGKKADLK